jgi:hypothetical protein
MNSHRAIYEELGRITTERGAPSPSPLILSA